MPTRHLVFNSDGPALAATLAWLFVPLLYIVQFGNRVLVLVQWAWSYLTWARSARLITGTNAETSSPAGTSGAP